MSYFKPSEFQCKCGACDEREVNGVLLSRLNGLRAQYGKPLFITSGWRCPPQNDRAGGVRASSHLTGHAADLFCTSSHDRYLLLFAALGLFNRIGLGTTFIHVDVDDTKPKEVVWLYGAH